MIASAIIILISMILGLILHFLKLNKPNFERVLRIICLLTLLVCMTIIVLKLNDYQLKGKYTEAILGLAFVCSTLILFGLTRTKIVKILSGLLMIPSLIISLIALKFKPVLIFPYILFLLFQAPMERFQLNDKLFADVKIGGFLACGESITINESKNFLLNQQYYIGNNLCVKGIYKIKPIYVSNDSIKLLIYHNDLENRGNPYIYAAGWKK